jgi:AraC-like DNA-binding protein
MSKNYQDPVSNWIYNTYIIQKGNGFMNDRSRVQDSIRYIENNLDGKLSLDELSKRAHLSKYHFHRLFHQTVGEPITRYINARRMEKASEELVRTDLPIIDIALKYQYGSQESFSRAFKRAYGMTPGKYRRASKSVRVISLSACRNKTFNMAA